jgi:hypothetical protein
MDGRVDPPSIPTGIVRAGGQPYSARLPEIGQWANQAGVSHSGGRAGGLWPTSARDPAASPPHLTGTGRLAYGLRTATSASPNSHPDTGQGEPKRPLPVPAIVAPSPSARLTRQYALRYRLECLILRDQIVAIGKERSRRSATDNAGRSRTSRSVEHCAPQRPPPPRHPRGRAPSDARHRRGWQS